ncbi:MAG: pilus assembly protein N-terminal domain-containing protein [bacterium]
MNYNYQKKNIIFGLLSIALLFSCSQSVNADAAPQLREMNLSPLSIDDKASRKISDTFFTPTEKVNADLKGSISEMTAFVGKSQLIRFNEPVKRISLTNPSLADIIMLSPNELLLNGKTAGLTSLIIWGETGEPVFFDLNIKNDPTILLKAVRSVYPNEKVDLKFTNSENVILAGNVSSSIVRDKIKSITEAYGYKFVDLSECKTPQIVLEVKVTEAARSFTKIISSSFALSRYADNFTFGVIPSAATAISGNQYGMSFEPDISKGLRGFGFNSQSVSTALSMAEQKGLVKILAEPKLVSTNGNKASFNAGYQVPVPSGIGEGGNVSYEYKDTGVNVTFTPTIQPESKLISLNIIPEVSEIDSTVTVTNQNSKIYGFKTRKAETTVQLMDGQTLVIAGLLKRTDNSSKDQIPTLGDIPIIGNFFKRSDIRKDETELLIFVTPRIIDSNVSGEGL